MGIWKVGIDELIDGGVTEVVRRRLQTCSKVLELRYAANALQLRAIVCHCGNHHRGALVCAYKLLGHLILERPATLAPSFLRGLCCFPLACCLRWNGLVGPGPNLGSAVIDPGSVSGSFVPDTYTLAFTQVLLSNPPSFTSRLSTAPLLRECHQPLITACDLRPAGAR